MRKIILMLLLISVITMSMVGCFGNFSLTRQVYSFNQNFENAFVRSILMWVMMIVPVYGLATWIDVVVLNVIEFWTGDNPIAMIDGESQTQFIAFEGIEYEVIATKNRFDITEVANPDNTLALVFDVEDNSWNLHKDGQEMKITQQHGKELKLFDLDGKTFATIMNY